jgi:hypothetical protein
MEAVKDFIKVLADQAVVVAQVMVYQLVARRAVMAQIIQLTAVEAEAEAQRAIAVEAVTAVKVTAVLVVLSLVVAEEAEEANPLVAHKITVAEELEYLVKDQAAQEEQWIVRAVAALGEHQIHQEQVVPLEVEAEAKKMILKVLVLQEVMAQ